MAPEVEPALVALRARLLATPRRRQRVEARLELTMAYVDFLFAVGHGRLGGHARAHELAAGATTALASVAADRVHGYLIAAFTARIEQAIAGRPHNTPMPEELRARLEALDRVTRYKVDRLREAARLLEPEPPDAVGMFSRNDFAAADAAARAARQRITTQLGDFTQPPAQRLDNLVEAAILDPVAPDGQVLAAIFDELRELPEGPSMAILIRALPLIQGVAIGRWELLLRAIEITGRFGWGELVPDLVRTLSANLEQVPAADLARVLATAMRALRRLGLREDLVALLDRVTRLDAKQSLESAANLAFAGGLAHIGDPRGVARFDHAFQELGKARTGAESIAEVRLIASGCGNAPEELALRQLGSLADQFGSVTDAFGTNSHYSLHVLDFVDSLVGAFIDLGS